MCKSILGVFEYRLASCLKAESICGCFVCRILMTVSFCLLILRCDTCDPEVLGYSGKMLIRVCCCRSYIVRLVGRLHRQSTDRRTVLVVRRFGQGWDSGHEPTRAEYVSWSADCGARGQKLSRLVLVPARSVTTRAAQYSRTRAVRSAGTRSKFAIGTRHLATRFLARVYNHMCLSDSYFCNI